MSAPPVIAPKKLIEVALPLDDINKAAGREKSIRHGHPSTLHLWWARRPLAAARAVLFAQLVNDPSWKYTDDELKKPQIKSAITKKRNELFKLLSELVQWESTTNEEVLERARKEIRASWKETCEANKEHPEAATLFDPKKLPAFHDPFAGGGAIPLEAQRLGLEAYATDLNPVAVLINKAMIEIPPRFAGRPPVGPLPKGEKQTKVKQAEDWSGAKGLAEDVRRYGAWMREEAEKRIGHLYPKVEITKEMAKERPDLNPLIGQKLTVIAWLWARTVKSPNPAFSDVEVPLVSSFVLASKEGKEAWVQPAVEKTGYRFVVRTGKPPKGAEDGTKAGRGGDFRCILSGSPITGDYIKAEGQAGRIGARLLATVGEGDRRRIYITPSRDMEQVANDVSPQWKPDVAFFAQALGFRVTNYGLTRWSDLFTPRQLSALTTFLTIAQEVAARSRADAIACGVIDDDVPLSAAGRGARAYAEALSVLLMFVLSNVADDMSTIVTWRSSHGTGATRGTFARHALPMTWDFAEANPFAGAAGDPVSAAAAIALALATLPARFQGFADQADARAGTVMNGVISTDPPYYDNIGYADLSDFFYVWLRRGLAALFPDLFATVSVPKAEELVATPARHGGKKQAEEYFLRGMCQAMTSVGARTHGAFPVTIYYAFKQADTTETQGTASTGWDTFLQAVIDSALGITGTWPMRTERAGRTRGLESNALASSIVLVCRPRPDDAPTIARKDFLRALERTMPAALTEMTADPIASVAPVDLAQAAIGPGMALFSRYSAVLEADGSPMPVRTALVHINKAIDDHFAQAEGEFDADTRFCVHWFSQYGFEPGPFGEADVLARAKGTAVDGAAEAGVLLASKGKVRLLRVKEYPKKWDPRGDARVPVWEACHQMCHALSESEHAAGELLARMPEKQDAIRQLAYQLYTVCERRKWAEDARAYNELIASWPAIVEESAKVGIKGTQLELLG